VLLDSFQRGEKMPRERRSHPEPIPEDPKPDLDLTPIRRRNINASSYQVQLSPQSSRTLPRASESTVRRIASSRSRSSSSSRPGIHKRRMACRNSLRQTSPIAEPNVYCSLSSKHALRRSRYAKHLNQSQGPKAARRSRHLCQYPPKKAVRCRVIRSVSHHLGRRGRCVH
jgi:hypothetical protein